MNWLFQKFYSLSKFARFLVVTILIIGASLIPIGLGFYQYSLAIREVFELDVKPPTSAEPFRFGDSLQPSHRLDSFFASCSAVDQIATEAFKVPKTFSVASLSTDTLTTLETNLASMSSLTMDDLFMFCLKSQSPENLTNYRLYRERLRFLASYTLAIKKQTPEYDSVKNVIAMEKTSLLTELSCPVLISKMVGLAGMGIVDLMIHNLARQNLLSASESMRILETLQLSESKKFSFADTMQFEYGYAEKMYLRLYRKAPFGSWMLEAIFGDPLQQYRDLLPAIDTLTYQDIEKRFPPLRTHILLMIALPNFTKARYECFKKEAWRNILFQELAQKAGITIASKDPFTGAALLSARIDEKTVWYSAGPDKKDDGMKGDDIFFPPFATK